MSNDPVNPAHYQGDYVMRIIEDFNLGFRTGNVIKYILRHGKKAGLEDLKKARWYLEREITHLEKQQHAAFTAPFKTPATDQPSLEPGLSK